MVLTQGGKHSNRSNRASKPPKSIVPILPPQRSNRIAAGFGSRPNKRRVKTFIHFSVSSTSSGSSSNDDASTFAPSAPPHAEPEPSSAPPSPLSQAHPPLLPPFPLIGFQPSLASHDLTPFVPNLSLFVRN